MQLWYAKVHRFLLQHGQEAVMLYTAITSTPPFFHHCMYDSHCVWNDLQRIMESGYPQKALDLCLNMTQTELIWHPLWDPNELHVPFLWRMMLQRKCGWHKQVSKRCWNLISKKMSDISHRYIYIYIHIHTYRYITYLCRCLYHIYKLIHWWWTFHCPCSYTRICTQ